MIYSLEQLFFVANVYQCLAESDKKITLVDILFENTFEKILREASPELHKNYQALSENARELVRGSFAALPPYSQKISPLTEVFLDASTLASLVNYTKNPFFLFEATSMPIGDLSIILDKLNKHLNQTYKLDKDKVENAAIREFVQLAANLRAADQQLHRKKREIVDKTSEQVRLQQEIIDKANFTIAYERNNAEQQILTVEDALRDMANNAKNAWERKQQSEKFHNKAVCLNAILQTVESIFKNLQSFFSKVDGGKKTDMLFSDFPNFAQISAIADLLAKAYTNQQTGTVRTKEFLKSLKEEMNAQYPDFINKWFATAGLEIQTVGTNSKDSTKYGATISISTLNDIIATMLNHFISVQATVVNALYAAGKFRTDIFTVDKKQVVLTSVPLETVVTGVSFDELRDYYTNVYSEKTMSSYEFSFITRTSGAINATEWSKGFIEKLSSNDSDGADSSVALLDKLVVVLKQQVNDMKDSLMKSISGTGSSQKEIGTVFTNLKKELSAALDLPAFKSQIVTTKSNDRALINIEQLLERTGYVIPTRYKAKFKLELVFAVTTSVLAAIEKKLKQGVTQLTDIQESLHYQLTPYVGFYVEEESDSVPKMEKLLQAPHNQEWKGTYLKGYAEIASTQAIDAKQMDLKESLTEGILSNELVARIKLLFFKGASKVSSVWKNFLVKLAGVKVFQDNKGYYRFNPPVVSSLRRSSKGDYPVYRYRYGNENIPADLTSLTQETTRKKLLIAQTIEALWQKSHENSMKCLVRTVTVSTSNVTGIVDPLTVEYYFIPMEDYLYITGQTLDTAIDLLTANNIIDKGVYNQIISYVPKNQTEFNYLKDMGEVTSKDGNIFDTYDLKDLIEIVEKKKEQKEQKDHKERKGAKTKKGTPEETPATT